MMANVSELLSRTCANRGTGARPLPPKVRIGSVGGETVRSVVTPDDFASEAEAQLAAEQLTRKL
jgi:hypothetical protein